MNAAPMITVAAEASSGGVAFAALAVGAVLLVLNGFFVAVEIALLAVRRGRLEDAADQGDRRARVAIGALDEIQFTFTGAQLGITMASLGLGAIAEPALAGLVASGLARTSLPDALVSGVAFVLAFGVVVFLHMVVGEMAPKNVALARAERVALALARPFALYVAVLRPFIGALNGIANALARSVGVVPVAAHDQVHSPEELALVLGEAHRRGTIAPDDVRLLSSVLRLAELDAGAAMTPRVELAALPETASILDALALAASSGHSRLPVHRRDIDDVVGIVHVKDLLVRDHPDTSASVAEMMRPIAAVPASHDLERLLREMLETHSQAALVVDEFGGTAGLITLEDVVEELVGDISDEFDRDREVRAVAPGVWDAHGSMRRDVLLDLVGLDLSDSEAETLSGWMVDRLGRLVVRGDRLTTGSGWTITVRTVEGRRAGDIELRSPTAAHAPREA